MKMLLRHLLSVAVLPFTVTVLVPIRVAQGYGIRLAPGRAAGPLALQGLGLVLAGLGLVLAAASVRRFAAEGKGTLAPWDPPKEFVVHRPYRFVRNPMISGVILVLIGEASVLLSIPHAVWAASFLTLNLLYIPLVEEPQLERRFGDPYLDYCRNVRRFVPRRTPWQPPPR